MLPKRNLMDEVATFNPESSLEEVMAGTGADRPEGPAFGEQFGLMILDVSAMASAALLGTAIQWFFSNSADPGFFGLWINYGAGTSSLIYGVLVVGALAWLRMLGHYTRRRPYWDETRDVLQVLVVLALLDATLMFSGQLAFSRLWWFFTWTLALFLIPAFRITWKRHLIACKKWQRPTLVLGCGSNAIEAVEALHSEPLMGFDVVAFARLTDTPPCPTCFFAGSQRLPLVVLRDPVNELRHYPALNVVVAMEPGQTEQYLPLMNRLQRVIADISIVPALKGLPLYGLESSHFFRHEALFLRPRNNLGRRGPQMLKRLFDIAGSALLLLLLSPVFIYIIFRIDRSGRTPFFKHTRIGHNGKAFSCYKFRTMVPDAEARLRSLLATNPLAREEWDRDFKLRNDPRVTQIGLFLRRTSLDELPQLWNVLRGDMSLVGPRPIIADEISRYGDDIDYYLEGRPGMTGLWQISGRNDADYRTRVYMDAWYVRNWSLWQDIVILIKTMRVVLDRSGAY